MHEIFEHTADLGIRVRAETPDALLEDAAHGLFSVMAANIDAVRPVAELRFQLAAGDLEELLHDWLSELLYTFHVKRLLLCEFDVHLDGLTLSAVARGEPIDAARHELAAEVKAITWCNLKVAHTAAGWLAEVVVDI